MRFFALAFVLCLPVAYAHADSSCDPVSNASLALTKTPDFTVYVAHAKVPSKKIIKIQGRPDGIYEPGYDKEDATSLVRKQSRNAFTEETDKYVKDQLAGSEKKCTLNTEDIINGKTMLVYVKSGDQIWIGKDDGLFYQLLSDKALYTIVYGLQE